MTTIEDHVRRAERQEDLAIGDHRIRLVSNHPDLDFDRYKARITAVLERFHDIHPHYLDGVERITLTDKKTVEGEEQEQKARDGLINGVNAQRTGEDWKEILMKERAYTNIPARYIRDNPDIQAGNGISHFEMILAHELSHNQGSRSQYQDTHKQQPDLPEDKQYAWMNHCKHEKALTFTGMLTKPNNNSIYFGEDGDIAEWLEGKAMMETMEDADGESVRYIQFPESGRMVPEKNLVTDKDAFLSNYTRNQMKINPEEEFCDAMAVYAFDPEFLKAFDEKHGTTKFRDLEARWGYYSKE